MEFTKKEARNIAKEKISNLQNRKQKEERILEQLLVEIQTVEKIFLFKADSWEINLDPIWEKFKNEKKFYFPKILSTSEKKMEFILPKDWKLGEYKLLEPIGEEKLSVTEAELVVLPALAYNKLGYRLGRGGGYYDRAFNGISSKKLVGVCFNEVFSIDFTASNLDIRVGRLITDNRVYNFEE